MRNKIKFCVTDFRAKWGKSPKVMWMNGDLYDVLNQLGIFYRGLDGNQYFRYSDYTVVRIAIDFGIESEQIVLTDAPG